VSNAVSSVSWSNVPNPSSINIDSSEIPPDCCCTISLNPNANASDRYQLIRREAVSHGLSGLEIDVFDLHSNKSRHISSLSGGETFQRFSPN
jgi:hypothetical protein